MIRVPESQLSVITKPAKAGFFRLGLWGNARASPPFFLLGVRGSNGGQMVENMGKI
jgi:hypothetical protein